VNLMGRVYFLNGRTGSVIPLVNERLTVFEALAQAGSQETYDRRDRVWLIREENGEKTYARLDLNSKTIFQSPYYYLHNNDVLYMQPGKFASLLASNSPARVILTSAAALISFILLFRNI
jgi:polysaccharide biosynthesis/export protein